MVRGYFEAGGSLGFSTHRFSKKGKTYIYAYPFIQTTDQDHSVALTFKEMFGGTASSHIHDSLQWRADRMRAYVIASAFTTFAPSRREFMDALSSWINADAEERIQIAEQIKGRDRVGTVTESIYDPLVIKPEFLAGAIDSRGTILSQQNSEKKQRYARLNVNSSNRPLLDRMRQYYGGYIAVTARAEDEQLILGHTSQMKRDKVY